MNLILQAIKALLRNNRSDWNQNDSSASSYVKNRPFYSEYAEKTIEATDETILDGFPTFDVGDTVVIKVDGVEQSLVAFDDGDGYVCVGDAFADLKSGEGQYGWQIDNTGCFWGEAHTVSYPGENVNKIDSKYLPNTVKTKKWYSDYETSVIDLALVGTSVGLLDGEGQYYMDVKTWETLLNLARLDGVVYTFDGRFPVYAYTQYNEDIEVLFIIASNNTAWISADGSAVVTYTITETRITYDAESETATFEKKDTSMNITE